MFGIGEPYEPPRVVTWEFRYIDKYILEDQSIIPIIIAEVEGRDYSEAENALYKLSKIAKKDILILKYKTV